ncbi:MAG TPA: fumarate reductase/succinate dehydrogenase flavoprotein subunit [Bdellovibrio sp.]|uniref:fumarate reductase/succinate dehydrogenase flavoprotein subunit n=1 Tax=Bdellovibrio sp. TaxID=28201 RepID=UPI002EE3DECD
MENKLDPKVPEGPLEEKWDLYKSHARLVNPANKRKYTVIIVGTGLAGASAASSLGELGYNVKAFCVHESPRRAHSVAAQGGINAAKNYQNDGDSIYRLFYDTIKGGDFRSREANVYRLAQISTAIIDQCVAQGVPFAREYGGTLANRSFGGTQVSRTFYASGQTGQQLLLGAYSGLMRQVDSKQVHLYTRREMLDLVVIDGHAKGIVVRNLLTGEIESHSADAVLLATGGYSNVYFLSTNAMACAVTAAWKAHKRGAYFANPCFTQIHPTCIPVHGENQSKLTLMSESLRNDGRIWVPKEKGDKRPPAEIPEQDRDYYLERVYPSFGNLVARDVASRQAKFRVDEGRGVGSTGVAVYLDLRDAIQSLGQNKIVERYGNLFEMYEKITGEDPFKGPMKIYPAPHYTMGGLWVDYELQSTIPGLFVMGEANFSDHGANRLGASSMMQGLADGYFIIPYTLGNYLATNKPEAISTTRDEFKDAEQNVQRQINTLMSIRGSKTVDSFHKRLGHLMWEYCGMSRNSSGLKETLASISQLRKEFWHDLRIPGEATYINSELEKAGRVADFLELSELMCWDALERNESCGGHFREEFQTPDNEAKRDDTNFTHVAAWEWRGPESKETRHREELVFETVHPAMRSYK